MHAKQIDPFLLYSAFRCFHHKILYTVVLVNVTCNKAKFLFSGHVNVMLLRVELNAYKSVVLW